MSSTKAILFFIGRGLLSLIFLIAGIKKIIYWQASLESVVMTLSDWRMHIHAVYFVDLLIKNAPFLLVMATILEILGGLILFVGYFFRFGAFLLLIFLIPTTFLYHAYWFQVGDQYGIEQVMFFKNLAIIGSLLLLSLGPRFKKHEDL